MGLLFSKFKKITPVKPDIQTVIQPRHPDTVSYDFNSCRGQERALREYERYREEKKEEKKINVAQARVYFNLKK